MRSLHCCLLAWAGAILAAQAEPVYFTDPTTGIYAYDSETVQGGLFATIVGTRGIACDKDGNVYVSVANTIYRYTPAGVQSPFFTGTTQDFRDLAFDPSGNLYAASSGKIYRISGGGITTFASGFLMGDVPIACDLNGNVFANDLFNDQVDKITPAGDKSLFYTASVNLACVVADAAGNVLLGSNSNGKLIKLSPTGTNPTVISVNLTNPAGFAFDAQGRLYSASTGTSNIDRMDTAFQQSIFVDVDGATHAVGDVAIRPIPEASTALSLVGALVPLSLSRRLRTSRSRA